MMFFANYWHSFSSGFLASAVFPWVQKKGAKTLLLPPQVTSSAHIYGMRWLLEISVSSTPRLTRGVWWLCSTETMVSRASIHVHQCFVLASANRSRTEYGWFCSRASPKDEVRYFSVSTARCICKAGCLCTKHCARHVCGERPMYNILRDADVGKYSEIIL